METTVWTVLAIVVQVVYGLFVTILFLYGLNSLILSIIYLVHRKRVWDQKPAPLPADLPRVTIQLPIYNERYTIKRLLQAMADLDYPADRLQIQVLDDSTDSTVDVVRPLVASYQQDGMDIEYIHRDDRSGYKAGALENGLKTATGEFVAVFDADFLPSRKWLKQVVGHFQDERVGFVQTRWEHKNDRYNLVTRLESLALDGHFIVEQNARYGGNLLMGFNGSGGIWRRAAIDDAGGWQSDTLTEDLDLSVRAELRGWNVVYLPMVTVPSEIPAYIDAVKKQQFRWAKGTVQTARKLSIPVLRSRLPLGKRLMGLAHLSMYMPFVFMIFTLLLVLPVGLINPAIFQYFPFTVLASFGPPIVYSLSRTEHLPRLKDRLALIPGLVLFGIGISLNCSLGAIEGLFTRGGVFERTPKFDLRNGQDRVIKSSYLLPTNPIVWGEVAMGLYNLLTIYVLWPTVGKAITPWLLSSAAGFFMMAWLSFYHHWKKPQQASKSSTEREPAVFS